MSRAIPLLPVWAFGPVTGYIYFYLLHVSARSKSSSACSRLCKERMAHYDSELVTAVRFLIYRRHFLFLFGVQNTTW
jgi:hypothetical protein